MSRPILADRSGVSLRTVNRILTGSSDSVAMANVCAVADVLGMELTVGPRERPLTTLEREARKKAEQIVKMVQGTSALEAQAVDNATIDEMIQQAVHELMAGSRRRLWAKM